MPCHTVTMTYVDVIRNYKPEWYEWNPLKQRQLKKKRMSVQNESDRGAIVFHHTAIPHKHSLVMEGECCNLQRRLHMARGEFGTILLPLWSTEWSLSVKGARTLVPFHQPWWDKFPLKHDMMANLIHRHSRRTGRGQTPQQAGPLWSFFEAGMQFFLSR